jgi:hypothetical protein
MDDSNEKKEIGINTEDNKSEKVYKLPSYIREYQKRYNKRNIEKVREKKKRNYEKYKNNQDWKEKQKKSQQKYQKKLQNSPEYDKIKEERREYMRRYRQEKKAKQNSQILE